MPELAALTPEHFDDPLHRRFREVLVSGAAVEDDELVALRAELGARADRDELSELAGEVLAGSASRAKKRASATSTPSARTEPCTPARKRWTVSRLPSPVETWVETKIRATTPQPNSSRTSRAAAAAGCSNGRMPPPGSRY